MQKIRKILRAVSEKTWLPTNEPTNQPIITNNTDYIEPGWRQSKKVLSPDIIYLVWLGVKLKNWKNDRIK